MCAGKFWSSHQDNNGRQYLRTISGYKGESQISRSFETFSERIKSTDDTLHYSKKTEAGVASLKEIRECLIENPEMHEPEKL